MYQIQRTEVANDVEPSARKPRTNELSAVESSFAGQIATAVWLGKLTDEGAREALLSYAIACHLCEQAYSMRMREALLSEYECWRERQDLVS